MKGRRMMQIVSLKINGEPVEDAVGDNMLLIDYLRNKRQLTGTKQGCDGGECGACTVLINGRARLACITLATTCDGAEIETIEGQARGGRLSALQRAFHENLGTQCGFCTPGMIMAAQGLLHQNPDPDDGEIRAALGGNICRCTGYVKIIKSVRAAAHASGVAS
jgi:4-hydroxybenzoyl-CoA reductase subunit gamma